MKNLFFVLLFALPLFGQDHTQSWPKIELGYAACSDSIAGITGGIDKEPGGSTDVSGTIVLWTTGAVQCYPTTGFPARLMLARYGVPYDRIQRTVIKPANDAAAELGDDVYVNMAGSSRLYFEIATRRPLKPGVYYAWNYQVN